MNKEEKREMERKKEGEEGKRGLFIPLGYLFVCLRVLQRLVGFNCLL